LDNAAFLKEVRQLAADRTKFVVTNHARKRNPGQGKFPLSDRAILNCINATGAWVSERPVTDLREAGGWKGRISYREPGTLTEISCVVVPRTRLLIITAYEVRQLSRAPRRPPGSPDTGEEESEIGKDINNDPV
jgi:hypothetical protein